MPGEQVPVVTELERHSIRIAATEAKMGTPRSKFSRCRLSLMASTSPSPSRLIQRGLAIQITSPFVNGGTTPPRNTEARNERSSGWWPLKRFQMEMVDRFA